MNNFSDMLSQAKKMQEKMKQIQENLKNIEVEGISGGNTVKVILKGNYEMKSIFVSEEAKKEKIEIVNDLIVAAYNDAKDKLKKKPQMNWLKRLVCPIYLLTLNTFLDGK